MQTQSVPNQVSNERPSARPAPPAGEPFDALLADVQAAQLLAVSGTLMDGSGLALNETAPPPSARRARVDQETATARQAEAASRGPGAESADAARDVGARREARLSADGQRPEARPAKGGAGPQSTNATAPLTTQTSNPSRPIEGPTVSDRDASKPVADTPVAPLPGNEAKTRPTADRPMSTEAATGEKAVSVTTGGAARAAQAAGPGRAGSPAENLARILATRSGDGDKPATATENPASRVADGKTKEAAAKPPAGQRPTGTQQSRAGTGTPDTRRMDFQRLVQSLRLSRGARQSSATMRLDPPTLGRMKVDLRMVGDSVQVRVEAATPEARDLLTARAKELTAALRTHDIVVERFEVITVGAEQETGTPPGAEDVGRQASQAHHREPEGQASRSATGDGGMTEDDAASATAIVVDWDAGPEARLDIRI